MAMIKKESEIIEAFARGGLSGGYKCPICGDVVYWVTYAHAERHGMTRDELRKICKPFGCMRDVERIGLKRHNEKRKKAAEQ